MVIDLNNYLFECVQSLFMLGGCIFALFMYFSYCLISRHLEFTYETKKRQHYSDLLQANKTTLIQLIDTGIYSVVDKGLNVFENYSRRRYNLSIVTTLSTTLSQLDFSSVYKYLTNRSIINVATNYFNRLLNLLAASEIPVSKIDRFKKEQNYFNEQLSLSSLMDSVISILHNYKDLFYTNRDLIRTVIFSLYGNDSGNLIYQMFLCYFFPESLLTFPNNSKTNNKQDNETVNVCATDIKRPQSNVKLDEFTYINRDFPTVTKVEADNNNPPSYESSIEKLRNLNVNSDGNPFANTQVDNRVSSVKSVINSLVNTQLNFNDLAAFASFDLDKIIDRLYDENIRSDVDFVNMSENAVYNVLTDNVTSLQNSGQLINILNGSVNSDTIDNNFKSSTINFLLALYYCCNGKEMFNAFYTNLINKYENKTPVSNNIVATSDSTKQTNNESNNGNLNKAEDLSVEDFIY